MFRPVAMAKTSVIILDKHLTAVTHALGRLGVVHLVDAVPQSKDHLLTDVDRSQEIRDLDRLRSRCAVLIESLGASRAAISGEPGGVSRQDAVATLDEVEQQLRAEDTDINTLANESGMLLRDAVQLQEFPLQKTRLAALRGLNHLYVATGRMPPTRFPELERKLEGRGLVLRGHGERESTGQIVVLSSRKNRWAVDAELKDTGFEKAELPECFEDTPEDTRLHIAARAGDVQAQIEAHRARIRGIMEGYGELLNFVRRELTDAMAVARAQEHFGQAAHLVCISGWTPTGKEADVRRIVDEITAGTGIVELSAETSESRTGADAESIPVKFEESAALRPFQRLVAMFGVPRYQEVEPSVFVAVSFLIMFGLMFGDVGQGAVIALLGWFLRRSPRPALKPLRDAGQFLVFAGISACVFGFLYGSVFGYEELLPALWLHPLHDVAALLKITVGLGVACISIGIGINIVNKIRTRRYFEGVFDKFGVIGILFYWGSIGLGIKAAKAGELVPGEVLLFVILPLAILFLREPLYHVLTRQRRLFQHDILSFILESSIEVMETVTAFLGSTVSFLRVGAFALSHAALCLAIYAIVDTIRGAPGSGLWMLLVVVVGNALVIVLEGMVVVIQGIRLQYYELFSKYLAGDGVLYAPFQLASLGKPEEETAE